MYYYYGLNSVGLKKFDRKVIGAKMAETDKDDLISIIEDDDTDAEIPGVLPLMPVRDVVVFTDMVLPLFVGREK